MNRVGYTSSLILFILFLLLTSLNAQVQVSGNNYLEYSTNNEKDTTAFENWAEAQVTYLQKYRVGLRYEIHQPPQTFSFDTSGHGIYQRYAEYRGGSINVRAGNFYALLGRGLVLRSYENRTLRWDTNIDGVKLDAHHSLIDIKLLAGRPRDRSGVRHRALTAGEITLKPLRLIHFGATYLSTHLPSVQNGRVNWGSLYTEVNHKFGSLYGEYARKDVPGVSDAGDAVYLNGNLFIGALSLQVELKDYDRFDVTEGVTYNNPPLVAQEHLFTLLNRHQLVQNANDERGFLAQISYPVIEDGVLTLNASQTERHNRQKLYQEFFAQFDWLSSFGWEFLWVISRQQDASARYLNFVSSTSIDFSNYNALKLVYEHQHTRVLLSDRQFYSQAVQISFSHAPTWTVSFLGEHSTDQFANRNYWAGLQLDVNFLKNFDLSVFGGTRRKGKICAGGVCVVKPELEGLEVLLISRF